jgi:hypothetical protein
MRSNHGESDAAAAALRPYASVQCASTRAGVRKLEVQLTVVPPPTQRPCRIVMPLSCVWRPADSW